METFIIIAVVAVISFLAFRKKKSLKTSKKLASTPEKWKRILIDKVNFYRNLDNEQRQQFEVDVHRFLSAIRITGVQTEVTIEDRLLVASSAVIPLFGFPAWSYKNLDEVLLYPASFIKQPEVGRNVHCPCGSGLKYKKCCMKLNQ